MAGNLDSVLKELPAIASEHLDSDDELWDIIHMHVEVMRARAKALHLELGLREQYACRPAGDTGSPASIPDVTLRDASLREVEHYAEDYQQALAELDEEKQQCGGFFDVLKALFVYQESPSRLLKKGAAQRVRHWGRGLGAKRERMSIRD